MSSQLRSSPIEEGQSQLGAVPGVETGKTRDLPVDVVSFMKNFDLEMDNILLFSDAELEKLVKVFEKDDTLSILLLNRLKKLRQSPKIPISVIKDSNSTTSKISNFGPVLFPDVHQTHKCRDVNKWPLVLSRTFRGSNDSVSISKFLTLLISYGVKESANTIEFFRYVLFNLSPEINVEVVNFLLSKEIMEDSNSSQRLTQLYTYLKNKYSITDNPNILFSRIEQMKQGTRSVSDFAAEFRSRVDELKTAQGSASMSEAYILSMFKRGLHESYRRCADDHVEILTLDSMIDTLMLWERNVELREGQLPNQLKIGRSKPQVGVVHTRCSFCNKPGHSEEKCWSKHPELKPAKFSGKVKSDQEPKASRLPFTVDKRGSIENVAPVVATTSLNENIASCNIVVSKPRSLFLNSPFNLNALLDTGASCSMINPIQAVHFLNDFPDHTSFEKLDSPITVQFGNEEIQKCHQTVILKSIFHPNSEDSFLVVPNLSVPIIIGVSDIEKYSLLSSNFLVETKPPSPSNDLQFFRNEQGRLVVSNSVFENANVLPWREKARSHSEIDLKIIDSLIDDMMSHDQVRQVTPDEVVITQELILVDKFVSKGILKPRTLPMEQNRFRLCLDCRPANALRLDNSKSVWIVNNLLFGPQKDSQTNEVKQSQRSALKLVESIPRSHRKFYAKLDIHNAFYSMLVTKSLSKLFGFTHRDKTYAMCVLPMGWFLSPSIFQDAISYVLDSCKDKLGSDISVVHQQDDILICGISVNSVETTMDIVKDTLNQFGFSVRPEKCVGPCDTVCFCGLQLYSDGSIKPAPSKRQLNELASDVAADMFSKTKNAEEVKHVLRSWLGTSNFYSKWLPGYLRSENLELHGLISKMDSNIVSIKEVKERAVKFVKDLCNWWLNESVGLYGGCDDENTLIVVDANKSGWSGVIFRLIEVENVESFSLPFSISGLLEANSSILSNINPEKCIVVPVRFDGDKWRTQFETNQSSTWRERCAAMSIVYKNRDILTGKVYLLSDNKNLVSNWKDYESLTTYMCNAYLTYISHVHGAVHVKRNHPVLQWVDQVARGVDSENNVVSFPIRVRDDENFSEVGDVDIVPKRVRTLSESDVSSVDVAMETDQDISSDFQALVDKGWIKQDGPHFYTTENYPGNVGADRFVIPKADCIKSLQKVHADYGRPTANGMTRILKF